MAKSKAPQAHAKWPALFKKHIGLLEAHMRLMDRLQQSMRAEMVDLEEEEKQQFLSGEKGNWKLVVGMRERTEECLKQARKITSGVLPQKTKQPRQTARQKERDEKERLKNGVLGEEPTQNGDASGDRSDSEEAVEANADFVPLTIVGKKRKISSAEAPSQAVDEGQANPYFVVDVEPTPVAILSGETKPKKVKKDKDKKDKNDRRASDLLKEPELIGKKTDEDEGEVPPAQSIPEAAPLDTEGGKKKKRRRSERSEVSEAEQDAKRAKKEKKKEKKEIEKSEKKKKKKRKAEESADAEVEEPAEGKKKKRKHKA